MASTEMICATPEATFRFGERLGHDLRPGNIVLLRGGLGAGKTLLTKGILNALDFDIDEVTSPSFTLVNLYRTSKFDVYHIDLWRLENMDDPSEAVGLNELLEGNDAVVIIEWADRLQNARFSNAVKVHLDGDGDEPRRITVEHLANEAAAR
jgi:tRNA threonylcarbamoyladenosine biosynthesis protein TsaE